ncbi:5568_t:CDS:2, partial [Diversispora eburnea]
MTSEQKYPGYDELTSYLMRSRGKSFYYFLRHYRDAIVSATSATFLWRDLDKTWCDRFLAEARKLGEDLKEKVNQERKRYNFEYYWNNVIEEVKIKEDILVREAEEARIQDELSRLRHKLSEIQENAKMQNNE